MPLKDPVARKAYSKAYTERKKEEHKASYEENKEKKRECYQQNKERLNNYGKARYKVIKELIGDQKIKVEISEKSQAI